MAEFVYEGAKTREISFPLGGIGSGCIGLAGDGRLVDWEIFNRPSKGSVNGYTHFAVKAERDGAVLDARTLQGDLLPPYSGSLKAAAGATPFGSGPPRGPGSRTCPASSGRASRRSRRRSRCPCRRPGASTPGS